MSIELRDYLAMQATEEDIASYLPTTEDGISSFAEYYGFVPTRQWARYEFADDMLRQRENEDESYTDMPEVEGIPVNSPLAQFSSVETDCEGLLTPEDLELPRGGLDAETACNFLNNLLHLSPAAVAELVLHRPRCSDKLVQKAESRVVDSDDPKYSRLGLLGIINGLIGGDKRVAIAFDQDAGVVLYFTTLDPEDLDE